MSPASYKPAHCVRSLLRLLVVACGLIAALLVMAPTHAAVSARSESATATAHVVIRRPAVIRTRRLYATGEWIGEARENSREPANRIERPCDDDALVSPCVLVIYDLP